MSQLTERSSITQESDGAELTLTDGGDEEKEGGREETQKFFVLYLLFGGFGQR